MTLQKYDHLRAMKMGLGRVSELRQFKAADVSEEIILQSEGSSREDRAAMKEFSHPGRGEDAHRASPDHRLATSGNYRSRHGDGLDPDCRQCHSDGPNQVILTSRMLLRRHRRGGMVRRARNHRRDPDLDLPGCCLKWGRIFAFHDQSGRGRARSWRYLGSGRQTRSIDAQTGPTRGRRSSSACRWQGP
jgi:hypothetical protein